jgi:hypothetical protein
MQPKHLLEKAARAVLALARELLGLVQVLVQVQVQELAQEQELAQGQAQQLLELVQRRPV